MNTITNPPYATSEVIVTVQRYDEPKIMIGVHQYNNGQYIAAPRLMGRSEAVQLVQNFLDDRPADWKDWEEYDPYVISLHDYAFERLVRGSLPIEFHNGWTNGDQEVLDRIRVFIKKGWIFEPKVPHCSKELRYRDAAGLDGGGSVQCLAVLFPDGSCPKENLHHDVFYANRSRTACYYGETHGTECKH